MLHAAQRPHLLVWRQTPLSMMKTVIPLLDALSQSDASHLRVPSALAERLVKDQSVSDSLGASTAVVLLRGCRPQTTASVFLSLPRPFQLTDVAFCCFQVSSIPAVGCITTDFAMQNVMLQVRPIFAHPPMHPAHHTLLRCCPFVCSHMAFEPLNDRPSGGVG